MRYRYLRFPGGKFKAVTLSYDDGVAQDIKLSELLCKYGLKCTFNLNSALERKEGLSDDQVREHIIGKGHELALHGRYHIASAAASPIDCVKDALFCRMELEERFDMIIRGMAYPDSGIRHIDNGNSYENVRHTLSSLGIVYSRTLGGDNSSFSLPTDFYAWMPTAHHNNENIFEYIDEFNSLKESEIKFPSGKWPRLFYLWGHSYEFDRNDNWDRIDKICSLISGKDDTWYATNIEIYDYIKAYESLVFSASNTRVYNPTLMTVWFFIDNVNYVIAPGETLKLNV